MPDNQYDTVLDALKAAEEKGFRYRFIIADDQLRCIETDEYFSPHQLTVESFQRVEGASDPDESAIIYLIRTSTNIKGTLTDSYGTYSNAEIAALLKKISIDRSETAGHFDNKQCLNCGSILQGPYCYQCGQKDEHLHEPFYIMVGHAIAHYWHFDSKFLNTFGPLIYKPGFLTKEYIEGRRVRYVHPVQLYFFISIVFFIVFASLASVRLNRALEDANIFLNDSVQQQFDSLKTKLTEVQLPKANELDSVKELLRATKDHYLKTGTDSDTGAITKESATDSGNEMAAFQLGNEALPKTVEAYEDSISRLSPEDRPGSFQKGIDRMTIRLSSMDRKEITERFSENAAHHLPKLMFVLIPIFALILKLLFIRRKIYFVDHAIFTLHFHAFVFLAMLIVAVIYLLTGFTLSLGWLFLILLFYLYLAIKIFYRQSYFKTFRKLISLTLLYSLALFFSGIVYLLVALFTV